MKSPLFICSENKHTCYHFKGQIWHKDIVSNKQWQGCDTVSCLAEDPVIKETASRMALTAQKETCKSPKDRTCQTDCKGTGGLL